MARKSLATLVAVVALMMAVPSVAQAQVYSPNELNELPRIDSPRQAMQAIERAYPPALRSRGIGGRVQVGFVVLPDGSVDPESVRIINAERDEFGQAATQAITEIKFKPGKKDGSPVAAQVVIPITFQVT
jgi:protein TonB